VSEEVDAKTAGQIKAETFPIRLKPEDWQSGSVNWLLDVIAPDRKTTGRVISNFGRVVKTGDLRVHPQIAGLVEPQMLEKMGASQTKEAAQ
jgi:cytolysin-activating lysine-acyltransferase